MNFRLFRKYCIFIFYVICMCFKMAVTQSSDSKTLNVLGFLPMSGSGWTGGAMCLPAAQMATRHVNEREGLLDGYNLTYSWVDSQCNAGVATYKMFEQLHQPPIKLMLLGCGCSTESEATAQVSHLFNVTQLSYGSSSPVLSDRKRFPNFFRVAGPDQKLNPAKVALMKEFNWKKVATINQALEFFSVVIDDFVTSVAETDITVISQEIFENDPRTRVENLKKHDARIIVVACYEDKIRLLLCHAFKVGLYGPKIVWLLLSWYSSEFWRQNLDDVPCTKAEMELAADGAFIIGYHYRNRVVESGTPGITGPEFDDLIQQEETYDPSKSMFSFVTAPCYDHIWVAALALNCTDAHLKAIGHPKTLDQFTYSDSDINEIILSCMANVSMTGISGSIHFEQGADPIKDARIQRIEGGKRVTVGTYVMDEVPRYLEWSQAIKWKDGNIPRDSTYVTQEEVILPVSLYVTMTTFAAVGIFIAIFFFFFNISHRNNRIVKLSSPNINSVLLLGCVLTYSTILMKNVGISTPHLCKARTFCFSIGFTMAFGAMFSKTWRVYKIFTNKKLLKVTIKDHQLLGIVCAIVAIIVGIMVIWEIIGPQRLIKKELKQEVYLSGNDAEVHPFVRVCYSEYSMYFGWTIYIIEGALLTFGAFLAWESRHIKIEALNDSRQIGMCIYNVVILSSVGLALTLLLEDQEVRLYGVTSGCVLIGTTATQLIVFTPKVVAVYRQNSVDSIGFQTYESTQGTASKANKPFALSSSSALP